MCILSRLKRLCCGRGNRHRFSISSNNPNNDIIYEQEVFDLETDFNNCPSYRYDNHDTPETILSWNVNEVLCFATPDSREKIVWHIKHFKPDIVCLQGLYNNNSRKYLIDQLKHLYQYFITGDLHQKYVLCEHSGLFILSKYPITFKKFVPYPNAKFPDTLCNKGVLYVKINYLNLILTDCHTHNTEHLQYSMEILKRNSPFEEYIFVGSVMYDKVHESLRVHSNNLMYTNKDMTVTDYILSVSKYIKLIVNVRHIDIRHVSYNYPIIARIQNNYMFQV
jgi:hypothetical protein